MTLDTPFPRDRAAWSRARTMLCAVAAVLLAACGGADDSVDAGNGETPPALAQIASIVVSPADLKVTVGLTQTVTAQARDQNGAVMNGVVFTWASSNPAVATVADGVVTGVSAGNVVITASSGGVSSNPVALIAVAASKGASVVVDKASLFMTGVGQSARLAAQVFDAQGGMTPASVRWQSSAPGVVAIDANGQATALAIGSATLTAEVDGVRSPPTLAIVAAPMVGAVLVSDAQVVLVGPILRLGAGTVPGIGNEYEVTLRGVSAPAIGAVMLAAESAPVAGKVVATRADPAGIVVTLALAPLSQLLSAYDIRLDVDLSRFGMEAVPARSAAAALAPVWGSAAQRKAQALARPLDDFEPFKVWDCDADIKPQLASAPIALSLENNLHLVLEDTAGHSKHTLEGSAEIVGSAGLKLKAGFKATGGCKAQGQIKLPVLGWFSVLVMPAVRFGLGADLDGEITLVEGELSIEGRVGVAPVLGWECGGATPECRGLNAFTATDKLKTTSKIPSKNDMRVKVSAHFFVVAGLDAAVFGGLFNVSMVEGRIGPKQSFDLGFEEDQAARPDYASDYDLKLEGVIEPGPALTKAIEKVIGSDSTTVKLKAEFSKDISESPKGTLRISTAKVRPGAPVDFTVELAPSSSLEYWQLGYNVTGLQLWRRREGELDFTFWKAMDQNASNQASYRWTPDVADAGKYEVAAFVNTQIGVPWLEVAKNSVQEVEVSCFAASGPSAKSIGPASAKAGPLATTCADTWVGTSTYIAKTPGLPTANIEAHATVTFVVDPANSQGKTIVYKAVSGSFTLAFNHPDACVTVLKPNIFPIVFDPTSPARLILYDDGFNPQTYGVGGAQFVDTTPTVSCPGRSDVVTVLHRFLASYAFGNGPYTPGQTTLSGSTDDAATTAIWSFSRP